MSEIENETIQLIHEPQSNVEVTNNIQLIDVIKFVMYRNVHAMDEITSTIIMEGTIDMLEVLKANNIPLGSEALGDATCMKNEEDVAITPIMRWLLDDRYTYDEYSMICAIKSGVNSRVKMLFDMGYTANITCVNDAIRGGNIDIIKTLHDRGCDFGNEWAIQFKYRYGQYISNIDTVRFIHEILKVPITQKVFEQFTRFVDKVSGITFKYIYDDAPDVCSIEMKLYALHQGWIDNNDIGDRIAKLDKEIADLRKML
jgi:hypothetical protein